MLNIKPNYCQDPIEYALYDIGCLVNNRGIESVQDLEPFEYLRLSDNLKQLKEVSDLFKNEHSFDKLLDHLIKTCHFTQYRSISVFK